MGDYPNVPGTVRGRHASHCYTHDLDFRLYRSFGSASRFWSCPGCVFKFRLQVSGGNPWAGS